MSAEGPSGLRHYYAAVGNAEAKLATLLELLHLLHRASRHGRPLAICCSARDTLDSVVYWLLQSQAFAVTAIHSDLTEKERELALMDFRRSAFGAALVAGSAGGGAEAAAVAATPPPGAAPGSAPSSAPTGGARERQEASGSAGRELAAGSAAPTQQQHHPQARVAAVLVLTDVCLKALPKDQLPVGVSLLVEFELPPTKEIYTRRLSALFGGGKDRRAQRCVVVDMVEAGQVGAFRTLEGFAAAPVQQLPVRVEDIFAQ